MKQPLVTVTQRQRTTRHGEPHKMRKRSVREVNGKVTVVHEWVPVPSEGYDRKVARASTTTRGLKNAEPEKKGGK
jgi:hypothetical protein